MHHHITRRSFLRTLPAGLGAMLLPLNIPGQTARAPQSSVANNHFSHKDAAQLSPEWAALQAQSTCICNWHLDGKKLTVANPRRVAGPLPHRIVYYAPEDVFRIDVERDPSLTGCQMLIVLKTVAPVEWQKEIIGWDLCRGARTVVVTKDTNRGPNTMLLERGDCNGGIDTIVFRKAKFLGEMQTVYYFAPNDFWPAYGGMKVTITWLVDSGYSNTYSEDEFAPSGEGDLLKAPDSDAVFVRYGGAKFWIPNIVEFNALGYRWSDVKLTESLPSISWRPGDGTLLRELGSHGVFVTYGGTAFWIPSPEVFEALGFNWGKIRVIPNGSIINISRFPYDHALFKELSNDTVYYIRGGQKFFFTSAERFIELCQYSDNVRVVPDGSLDHLPTVGAI